MKFQNLKKFGARLSPLRDFIQPELARLVDEAPAGDEWLHEIKFDGYRILSRIDRNEIHLFTRNGNDWTAKFPHLCEALRALPVKQAWLDGEVVVMTREGRTSFQKLQQAFDEQQDTKMDYYLFDLIYLDGNDLSDVPLLERKRLLEQILRAKPSKLLHFSEHIIGKGGKFLTNACEYHLEGVVSKRVNSPYRSGRGGAWMKSKCTHEEEFVIVGFTQPGGSRTGFGALLLGTHEGRDLVYAGKVGTGFNQKTLREMISKLEKLATAKSPLKNPPRERGVTWVKPKIVGQIHYTEKTDEGLLRHPSFLGLRLDKSAKEVVPEVATPVKLSNPDKILYPEMGITKRDLLRFYQSIEKWILPELLNRPLMIKRCPEGVGKSCFYQKHTNDMLPDSIKSIAIKEKDKSSREYIYVDSSEGVFQLVQMGSLEFHTWGSKVDHVDRPDRMVFDLDPEEGLTWKRVVDAALHIRKELREIGLESFLKTSGGKGLHIVVPLKPVHTFDEVKAFSKMIVEAMVEREPKLYTSNMSKKQRRERIFIDYLRNARGSTFIAPYSTRARIGATVATPIFWEELTSKLRADQFNIKNLGKRLASLKSDPWKKIRTAKQSLPDAFFNAVA
jgi:bifunctional non-homologous end joining protein LigD